jgi:hypothetical protein
MWPCLKCRETLDDDFDVCWNCGTTKDGVEDPNFRKADDAPAMEEVPPIDPTAIREVPDEIAPEQKPTRLPVPLHCLRCHAGLKFAGTKSFHGGFSWGGVLGDWGEFLVNQESFDLYLCPRCGHAELFATGIGEDLRPRETE